jgi:hypothetical protein
MALFEELALEHVIWMKDTGKVRSDEKARKKT